MSFTRPHHQEISIILDQFDSDYLRQNNILFGGGTRIALELNEFRESVDIDLFCIGQASYRAARSEVTNTSFGKLFKPGCNPERHANKDIRADRDAIRALLAGTHSRIKLEIINFSNSELLPGEKNPLFPIDCVSKEGCFASKLTANADRYLNHHKDIIDLCMMRKSWGNITCRSWEIAFKEYGRSTILSSLKSSLERIKDNSEAFDIAVNSLNMDESTASEIICQYASAWLEELTDTH